MVVCPFYVKHYWISKIYALLSQNFVVRIYALFPQIFLDWKVKSADIFTFGMYGKRSVVLWLFYIDGFTNSVFFLLMVLSTTLIYLHFLLQTCLRSITGSVAKSSISCFFLKFIDPHWSTLPSMLVEEALGFFSGWIDWTHFVLSAI